MSDQPENKQFDSFNDLIGYLKEHTDDFEEMSIPVLKQIRMRQPNGKIITRDNPGALLLGGSGTITEIHRDHAQALLNDGVLQRMGIKIVLDPK